jgi:ferredoxin
LTKIFNTHFRCVSIRTFLHVGHELETRRVEIMKVKIDYDLCMGDRNCNKVCPEVFEYDEDKLISRVLVDEVPKRLEPLVRKAAKECAPGAIIIEE